VNHNLSQNYDLFHPLSAPFALLLHCSLLPSEQLLRWLKTLHRLLLDRTKKKHYMKKQDNLLPTS